MSCQQDSMDKVTSSSLAPEDLLRSPAIASALSPNLVEAVIPYQYYLFWSCLLKPQVTSKSEKVEILSSVTCGGAGPVLRRYAPSR